MAAAAVSFTIDCWHKPGANKALGGRKPVGIILA